MSPEDKTYYEQRAEEELDRAQKSDEPAAVKAHYLLAGFYLDLVYGGGRPANSNAPFESGEEPSAFARSGH